MLEGTYVQILVFGIALLGFGVAIYMRFFRPWQLRWGATNEEVSKGMPGDQYVKDPDFNATRAITIEAQPEEIWPWLLQMGFQRAGFYSYDWIDSKNIPSKEVIVPELQKLDVGDKIPLNNHSAMVVSELVPNRRMLWVDPSHQWSWLWALHRVDDESTRLITRLRVPYHKNSWKILTYLVFEFGDFIMMRKCMYGIKMRAESA
jgi:hypothetical protein